MIAEMICNLYEKIFWKAFEKRYGFSQRLMPDGVRARALSEVKKQLLDQRAVILDQSP